MADTPRRRDRRARSSTLAHSARAARRRRGRRGRGAWRRCATLGCDVAQGYHAGPPEPAPASSSWCDAVGAGGVGGGSGARRRRGGGGGMVPGAFGLGAPWRPRTAVVSGATASGPSVSFDGDLFTTRRHGLRFGPEPSTPGRTHHTERCHEGSRWDATPPRSAPRHPHRRDHRAVVGPRDDVHADLLNAHRGSASTWSIVISGGKARPAGQVVS